MDNIYNKITEAINNNVPSWLVTVTNVTGSTPAAPGMKMIVYANGNIFGTVGGGDIEKKVIDKIVNLKPADTVKWSYDLGADANTAETTTMICGGIQEVLVEPLLQGLPLYILGGGHCGIALSNLAGRTGFLVTVIDNRSEWASKTKHPNAADTIYCDYSEIAKRISFPKDCYIVIMTHGHLHDAVVLEQLINTDYKYLGMIGSKRKVKIVLEDLIKKGIHREKIKNVFSPVGLDLLTHTPDEIAVSIVAQMIAVKNGKDGIIFNQNPLLG
jgi:xanthine dehydrogenase accessory factor